jgi:predicted RNA-binding protein YlxR (DUF448 family)
MGAHVPSRTCVGCRDTASKPELLRLVRSSSGGIRIDPDGRAPGRGAYVHRSDACVDQALRRGALARALRTSIGSEEARKLRGMVEGMQGNA